MRKARNLLICPARDTGRRGKSDGARPTEATRDNPLLHRELQEPSSSWDGAHGFHTDNVKQRRDGRELYAMSSKHACCSTPWLMCITQVQQGFTLVISSSCAISSHHSTNPHWIVDNKYFSIDMFDENDTAVFCSAQIVVHRLLLISDVVCPQVVYVDKSALSQSTFLDHGHCGAAISHGCSCQVSQQLLSCTRTVQLMRMPQQVASLTTLDE